MKRLYLDVVVRVNEQEKKARLEVSLPEDELVVLEIPALKVRGLTQVNSEHTLTLLRDQKEIDAFIDKRIAELKKLKG